MDELEALVMSLIAKIEELEERIDDLQGQAGETNSIEPVTAFPSNPYGGQIVVRVDEIATNGGGTMYIYNADQSTWEPLTQ